MDDIEERAALARLKQGDITALDSLVRQYQVQAVRAATLITRDRALAEDIVQSAFIRAYEKIHQFDLERPFGPWFLRSVVNAALKATQRQARHSPLPMDNSTGEEVLLEDPGLDPEALFIQAETTAEIAQALRALSPQQRAALILRYYVGLNATEIAHALACSPSTVRQHLHRARRRLAHLLRRGPAV
jgi:RNA polymerase sigma-70 factor (ECF subfamily)